MGTALGGFGSSIRVRVSKRIRADEDRRPLSSAIGFRGSCRCTCRVGCPGFVGGACNRRIDVDEFSAI
jgi:hypothetical protein